MAKSDIFLRKNRVSVVGKGTKQDGEIERGAFEVSVPGKNAKPSIRMSPQHANLNVGGGDGVSTEGDLRINDDSGKTRIQMTGSGDVRTRPLGQDRVWINGGSGSVVLGEAGEDHIRIDGTKVEDTDSQEPRIGVYSNFSAAEPFETVAAEFVSGELLDLSKSTGVTIGNTDRDGAMVMMWGDRPGVVLGDGLFMLGNSAAPGAIQVQDGSDNTTAEVRGKRGNINVGGPGKMGSIALRDDDGAVAGWVRAANRKKTVNGKEREVQLELTDSEGVPAMLVYSGGAVEFPNGEIS